MIMRNTSKPKEFSIHQLYLNVGHQTTYVIIKYKNKMATKKNKTI